LQHYPNVPCLIHPILPPVDGAQEGKKPGIILGPIGTPRPPKKRPMRLQRQANHPEHHLVRCLHVFTIPAHHSWHLAQIQLAAECPWEVAQVVSDPV